MTGTIIGSLGEVNWAAAGVCLVVVFVLGSIWFAPQVFGNYWARQVTRYTGTPEADVTSRASRPASLLKWIVALALNVAVVAILVPSVGADSAGDGIALALAVWLGFGATFSGWPPIFARMPWEWWLVNNGAFLIMQIAAGTILAVWR